MMRAWLMVWALLLASASVWAEDLPVYRLELKDGKLNPARLQVAAGKKFKIELINSGKTPVEFESIQLRKEKVLGPGVESFVVVHPLSPGEYKFFDEFHMATAQGVIVAK
ncbi:cupredoxin domain-containing protein [Pseudogulbenkiania sp. MAI-1]|uniref:cupredoxin domain-containing protein n=1 Tax=Pseudogulbenkiania sp. MAI-1 TaxID=990370 RepID=UPI00045E79A2|nr:cupredoxin domain-containing protein [Pseudogulbenkiania sp. MAI-1]